MNKRVKLMLNLICGFAWPVKLDLFSECADGHYNKSSGCSQQCGHCAGRKVCNKNTGHCPSCEPGWMLPRCQQRKSFWFFFSFNSFLFPQPGPAGWLQTKWAACPNCFCHVCDAWVVGPTTRNALTPLQASPKETFSQTCSNSTWKNFFFEVNRPAMFSPLTLLFSPP